MDEGTLNDCITKGNDYKVDCDMRALEVKKRTHITPKNQME
jgi:hypothetical protein